MNIKILWQDLDRRRAVLLSLVIHLLVLLVMVVVYDPPAQEPLEPFLVIDISEPAEEVVASPDPEIRITQAQAVGDPVAEVQVTQAEAVPDPSAETRIPPTGAVPEPEPEARALQTEAAPGPDPVARVAAAESVPAPAAATNVPEVLAVPHPAAQVQVTQVGAVPDPSAEADVVLAEAVPAPDPAARLLQIEAAPGPDPGVEVILAEAVPGPLPQAEVAQAEAVPDPLAEARLPRLETAPGPDPGVRVTQAQAVPGPVAEARVAQAQALPGPAGEARIAQAQPIVRPEASARIARPETVPRPGAAVRAAQAAAFPGPEGEAVVVQALAVPGPGGEARVVVAQAVPRPAGDTTIAPSGPLPGPEAEVRVAAPQRRSVPDDTVEERRSRPLVVLLDNTDSGYPQAGLLGASQVVEMPVEGGLTRLLTVFDRIDPDQVGPIRSARPYFLELAQSMDGILVHDGGSPGTIEAIAESRLPTLNAYHHGDLFSRADGRIAPYNLYSRGLTLREAVHRLDMNQARVIQAPVYRPDDTAAPGQSVDVRFSGDYRSGFRYVQDLNLYRWIRNGASAVDASGEAVFVHAVVAAEVAARPYPLDTAGRLYIPLSGGGATLFVGGRAVPGSWVMAPGVGVQFTDAAGKRIDLAAFKIWVMLTPTYDRMVIR